MKARQTISLIAMSVAMLIAVIIPSSALALPQLDISLDRAAENPIPVTRSDERLAYQVTVENTAPATPEPGSELACEGTPAEGVGWYGSPAPTDFRYRWLRNGTPISGAEGSWPAAPVVPSYTLTASDEGKSIQCEVIGTNQAKASGTATMNGTNVITEVVTATGSGSLSAGSKMITGVSRTGFEIAVGETITGPGIPPGTTVANRAPFGDESRLEMSQAATQSGSVSFSAGPYPIGVGASISGTGIPGGTTVVAVNGTSLTLSASTTAAATGVPITGEYPSVSTVAISQPPVVVEPVPSPAPPTTPAESGAEPQISYSSGALGDAVTCTAPTSWTGTGITWTLRFLRNGEPAPHGNLEETATTAKYELKSDDISPSAVYQCLAIATDTSGNEAVAISAARVSTKPSPPGTAVYSGHVGGGNRSEKTRVNVANSLTGAAVDVSLPAGTKPVRAMGIESDPQKWRCLKTSSESAPGVRCTRTDQLAPGESYPPIELIAQVRSNAPEPLVTEACASGGGAPNEPCESDSVSGLLPAIPFGFSYFETFAEDESGAEATQAGEHPYAAGADLGITEHVRPEFNPTQGFRVANGRSRVIRTEVPPGFVGDPEAVDKCPSIVDVSNTPSTCPAASVVGIIDLKVAGNGIHGYNGEPIYAIEPERGTPAQFAFAITALRPGFSYTLAPELDPKRGYAINLATSPNPMVPELYNAKVTLCNRGAKLEVDPVTKETKAVRCWTRSDPQASERPFLTLPTKCGDAESATTRIFADSWEHPGQFAKAEHTINPPQGCESLAFEPEMKARPTTNAADSPTGLDVSLHFPQNEDPEGLATSQLKKTVLTLPEGITVNPSAANGLDACSEAQVGLGSNEPVRCPNASKVGAVSVTTPLLGHALPGTLYIASPHQNPFGTLLALYLVVEDPQTGIVVKLPGRVDADSRTGQIKTVFDDNPQTPIEDVQVKLRSGAGAPLRTPAVCGRYKTSSEFTPWSAPESGPPAKPADTYSINRGPQGGSCPQAASEEPNQPSFEAGSASPISGIYTPFVVKLRRDDGSQEFSSVTVTPPPGLLGKLVGIPDCPDASLAEAEAKSGHEEQAHPSCPAASRVGSVVAGAGAGPAPYYAGGTAYLAGPYKGAPLSLAVVTPAVAGPFDLGTVVVRAALQVNPETAQITAVSDPLPRILQGIPLDIRSVTISMDRSDFTLNGTSCDPLSVGGQVTSTQGQAVALTQRFQLAECARLRFKPNLNLKLKGATKRTGHPGLRAVLTARPGEANIGRAQVNLPHGEFLDQGNLNKTCTKPVLLAGGCPASSVYGRAKAWTPLLEKPLEGNVYLVGGYGYKLPALVAELNGRIRVLLAGKVDSGPNKGIRNTFEVVPDAPVEKFELSMKGGKKYGLLENSENLCKASKKARRAIVSFTGQNGKVNNYKPVVQNQCGKKGKKHKKKSSHHKRAPHKKSRHG